ASSIPAPLLAEQSHRCNRRRITGGQPVATLFSLPLPRSKAQRRAEPMARSAAPSHAGEGENGPLDGFAPRELTGRIVRCRLGWRNGPAARPRLGRDLARDEAQAFDGVTSEISVDAAAEDTALVLEEH